MTSCFDYVCERCGAQVDEPCRTASGAVAYAHANRRWKATDAFWRERDAEPPPMIDRHPTQKDTA